MPAAPHRCRQVALAAEAHDRHHRYDRDLTELVGELSMRSEDFRVRWASHDVRQYRTGTQPFHYPLFGDLTLSHEALQY